MTDIGIEMLNTCPAGFPIAAMRNIRKWGIQDRETLALAIAEEAGEIAQAVLKAKHEGGDRKRISEEAEDLGALCIQMIYANMVLD